MTTDNSDPFKGRRHGDTVFDDFRDRRAPSLIMSHVSSSISSGIDATHSSAFWIA
jgi:hypothetical protein